MEHRQVMGPTYVVSALEVLCEVAVVLDLLDILFRCLLARDILSGGAFFSSGLNKASTVGMNTGTGRINVCQLGFAGCARFGSLLPPFKLLQLVPFTLWLVSISLYWVILCWLFFARLFPSQTVLSSLGCTPILLHTSFHGF